MVYHPDGRELSDPMMAADSGSFLVSISISLMFSWTSVWPFDGHQIDVLVAVSLMFYDHQSDNLTFIKLIFSFPYVMMF